MSISPAGSRPPQRGFAPRRPFPACSARLRTPTLIQHQKSGKPERLGHGYLIPDYPLTRAVIEERRPQTVSQNDPDPDPNEVRLLRELGYDALLMVAIEASDGAWGLVEVYGETGRRFDDAEVQLAQDLATEVGEILKQLEQPK